MPTSNLHACKVAMNMNDRHHRPVSVTSTEHTAHDLAEKDGLSGGSSLCSCQHLWRAVQAGQKGTRRGSIMSHSPCNHCRAKKADRAVRTGRKVKVAAE